MRSAYSNSQLAMLRYLKQHGPVDRVGKGSLLKQLAVELGTPVPSLSGTLRVLEERSLVLRTYTRPLTHKYGEDKGARLVRVELVDPKMEVPGSGDSTDDEPVGDAPTAERMVDALVDRVLELTKQVDKLQNIVIELSEENERLRERARSDSKPSTNGRLAQRVQSALTPAQWAELKGGK